MVFFACDLCGDSVKKKQVPNHFIRCKSTSFSCMDCQKVFDRDTYNEHIKCISENEKYGGSAYVAKQNKGELKQDAWVQRVQAAIHRVKDKKIRGILQMVKVHKNIPRKEGKFINFLANSLRIRDAQQCKQVWDAISTAANTVKEEHSTDSLATKSSVEETTNVSTN